MPLYSNLAPPYAVYPRDAYDPTRGMGGQQIVSAEQLGAGNFSQRVAIADKDGQIPAPVTLTFAYASAPASVQYDIYVAWDDQTPPAVWTKVGSTTNVNGDQVTIQRSGAGAVNFRFICVKEVVSPGVNATVAVRM